MVTEREILKEAAEKGEVICQLYERQGNVLGVTNEAGFAKEEVCKRLGEKGKLRWDGWKGQRSSPYGKVSRWKPARPNGFG